MWTQAQPQPQPQSQSQSQSEDCDATRQAALMAAAYPGLQAKHDEQTWSEDGVERIVRAVCKVWPSQPQYTLLAVTLIDRQPDPNSGELYDSSDMEVLVASSSSGVILHRRREMNLLGGFTPMETDSEAPFVSRLALDTARYQLAPDHMAFGVRIIRQNFAGLYSESLWLYLIEPIGKLSAVLNPVIKSLELAHTEAGPAMGSDCVNRSIAVRRTLAVDPKTKRNGLSGLIVRGKTETETTVDCGEEEANERVVQPNADEHLLFDGETYPLKSALCAALDTVTACSD